ncbi:MAG: YlxR family protein [Armatimonadetes bacterium]|nr:YlxR family protein [Armatimonadota bacterium]MDW8029145.1 YlxR family protein [Armatimonadota bacterium]
MKQKRRKGHNYERICIGCGQFKHKRDLVRIAILRDGLFVVDEGQKLGGRGLYLCPIADCAISMVKKRSLFSKLKHPIGVDKRNELLSQLKRHILWMSGDLIRLW